MGESMLTKLVLLIALADIAASTTLRSNVDFVENVREYEQIQGRIVSGHDAALGQFPYQAHLRAIDQSFRILGCGGSVIHESWVITAAHCTANNRQITVRAGLIEMNSAEYISDSWDWYNHPTYNSDNPGTVQPNDVALIKLTSPITFSSNVQRVRIQPSTEAFSDYSEERLIASGWGRTWTQGATATTLQWTYLRGVDNAFCLHRFTSRFVNSNTICARWHNVTSQSVCQGDSGGPLVQYKDGVPTLVGVTSFVARVADGGCHSGEPGGFIRPGPFLSWFQQVTDVDFDSLDDPTTTPTPTTTTPEPTPEPTPESTPEPTPKPTPEPEKPDETPEEEEDDDDDDISELLKKLQVKVRVEVNLKKYKKVAGKTKEIEHTRYLPIK
ncbi:unnamed protein product [Pieris brassicae]|uniref:Peptidase S1 domain-containing protein n=1 Tax=Pieris brassicae TaxID=7116 RepID=A0A9P0THH6_PIEBR|nr:unnamed protein product [Pieris brassicae]